MPVLLLCASALWPAAQSETGEEQRVLTMYVAYGGPDLIAKEFEKATGIKVELLTMSSGEVLSRLRAEKSNPQTDVWFGGGSDAFIQAKTEGLIAAYRSPNAKNVDPAFKDGDGYWTGLSLVVVGFLVNDERLKNKGLPLPRGWADLADPVYKDELMASNPNTSGPAQKALAGEFAVGIVPDPHNTPLQNPGASLTPVFPSDGVLAWPSPVAIIEGAKHPQNARRFVDWCLSPGGQKVLMQASPRVPTTDVETLAGVPRLSELNLVAYDHLRWGNERERVVAEFNRRYPQYQ